MVCGQFVARSSSTQPIGTLGRLTVLLLLSSLPCYRSNRYFAIYASRVYKSRAAFVCRRRKKCDGSRIAIRNLFCARKDLVPFHDVLLERSAYFTFLSLNFTDAYCGYVGSDTFHSKATHEPVLVHALHCIRFTIFQLFLLKCGSHDG